MHKVANATGSAPHAKCGMNAARLACSLLVISLLASCTDRVVPNSDPVSTTIPIKIVGKDPLIDVHVNGVKVTVLFDIGRSTTLSLFPSFLDQIEKRPMGEIAGGTSMDGPTGKIARFQVDSAQMGNISFKQLSVEQDFHDPEYQAEFLARNRAHGFAGTGLFKNKKIVIDYKRGELTIISPDAPHTLQSKCSGNVVKLVTDTGWGIVSKANTEIGEIVFVWDTGAPANMVFKKTTDATNLPLEQFDELILNELTFNKHNYGPARFFIRELPGIPFDGFIGYDFFANHTVCVDFLADRLLISQ